MKKNWKKLLASMGAMICISVFSMGSSCPGDFSGGDDVGLNTWGDLSGFAVTVTGGLGPYTINVSGGNGANGSGQDAGALQLLNMGGQGVKLGVDRTVNPGFTLPAQPNPYLGESPAVIKKNTVVEVYVNQGDAQIDDGLLDGGLYMFLGNSGLWVRDRVGGDYPASGLKVNEGVSLTLGLNYNDYGASGQDGCVLEFPNDIVIAGKVTVNNLTTGNLGEAIIESGAIAEDQGWLDLWSWNGRVFLADSGRITTAGGDATIPDQRGGNGGWIGVYSAYGSYLHGTIDASGGDGLGLGSGGDAGMYAFMVYGIDLVSAGMVTSTLEMPGEEGAVLVNTGPVNASGGKGAWGGQAGYIFLGAESDLYNRGALIANGGQGLDGSGGSGYVIQLYSFSASLYNSGKLQGNGGQGAYSGSAPVAFDTSGMPGSGGSGAYIFLDVGEEIYFTDPTSVAYISPSPALGRLINSGVISAKGGQGVNGDGGSGGLVQLANTLPGDLIHKAPINNFGGKGGNGNGGDGGVIAFINFFDSFLSPRTDLVVAGNLDCSGGKGSMNGGLGGAVIGGNIDIDYLSSPGGSPAVDVIGSDDVDLDFVGYTKVLAQGGDGGGGEIGDGGDGGEVFLGGLGKIPGDSTPLADLPLGQVSWRSILLANGGNSASGWGGAGGLFVAGGGLSPERADKLAVTLESIKTVVFGIINLNGGVGYSAGGPGGEMDVFGYNQAEVTAAIFINGGDATVNSAGFGGYAGFYSMGDVVLEGLVRANGGAGGNTDGGLGGTVVANAGAKVRSAMSISAKGGSSASMAGGAGGGIYLTSLLPPTIFDPNLTVRGGPGAPNGAVGEILIDGATYKGLAMP